MSSIEEAWVAVKAMGMTHHVQEELEEVCRKLAQAVQDDIGELLELGVQDSDARNEIRYLLADFVQEALP